MTIRGDGSVLLLVEDDELDREMFQTALNEAEELSAVIYFAPDGEQALMWLKNNPQPDVIVLDLKLPKLSGLQVLRQIKSTPGIESVPVVLLTSSDDEKDVNEGYMYGANAYVVKPISWSHFRETVVNIGRFWVKTNRSPVF